MNQHGLFQKGVHPSPEMRAKMALAQQRRWAIHSKHARELADFLLKVQQLLDQCRSQIKQ